MDYGKIVIGTKVDTTGLEKGIKAIERNDVVLNITPSEDKDELKKQISEVEKEIAKADKEFASLKIDPGGVNLEYLEKLQRKVTELYEKFNSLNKVQTVTPQAQKTSFTISETDPAVSKYMKLFDMVDEYRSNKKLDIINSDDIRDSEELLRNINQTRKEIEKITGKKVYIKGIDNTNRELEKTNSHITGILKKMSRWVLAIFSIRSAYSLVRNAVSTLSQYNDDLASKLEGIRLFFASALAPIIEKIVNLFYKILTYVNYIAKAWFGVDLFQGAKNLKSMSNSANELRKTLLGFDEMNILNDNGTTGAAGSIFPDMDKVKIPDWVDAIARNKDAILGLAAAMGLAFGAYKIGQWISNIGKMKSALGSGGLLGSLKNILALGLITVTIALAIKNWQEVKQWQKEIDNMIEQYEKRNELGITTFENESDISKMISQQKTQLIANRDILKSSSSYWADMFGMSDRMLEIVKQYVTQAGLQLETWEQILEKEDTSRENKKEILDLLLDELDYLIEVGKQLDNEGKLTDDVIDITNEYRDTVIKLADDLGISNKKIDDLKATTKEVNGEWGTLVGAVASFNNTPLKDKKAVYTIDTKVETKKAETDFSNFATRIAQAIPSTLKNLLSGAYNSFTKLFGLKTGGIIFQKPVYHAAGTLINLPGRGVPLGANHYGGEAGVEGVLPLTDNQAMETLGKMIGEHIKINITNVTKLDSKQISRETKKADAENEFATNR